MRFTGASQPVSSTASSCSPNNKMDLVGSPYYMAQSAAYFRTPNNSVSAANGIHSFPTPPPAIPSYYDAKCAQALPGL